VRLKTPTLLLHRWISLVALAFWFVQAVTGAFLIFHWEIDDALLDGRDAPLSLPAIEERIGQLTAEGSGNSIGSMWTSAGSDGRFDLYMDTADGSSVVRVNGAGEILRSRPDGERFAHGGWIDSIKSIHHQLMSGAVGSWVVGISGILLFTNILLGLVLAWPIRGQWRRALKLPAASAGPVARSYGWHRSLGMLAGIPALFTVAAGVLLVFSDQTETIITPEPMVEPILQSTGPITVGLAEAATVAMKAYPAASLSAVYLADSENPIYQIRLRQPGEDRRAYGKTAVWVSAIDGQLLQDYDALNAPGRRRFVDGLFPFHTGEFGGKFGRFATLLIGLWMALMVVLGLQLYLRRRKMGKRR